MEQYITLNTVEKWKIAQITCMGKTDGNPFTDYQITGHFVSAHEDKTVDGFYNGNGSYVVRFMPSFEENYTFTIRGSFSSDVYKGSFTVKAAQPGNHGMVKVSNTYHFAYEDGTLYYPLGTTCYVWQLQKPEIVEQTLRTLKMGYFNKIRFCVFPKHYDYNLHEPSSYPYEGTPCDSSVITSENFQEFTGRAAGNDFNYKYFNVAHFEALDKAVEQLDEMGIEADIIIMHPYDRWGFSMMSKEEDDLYWNYLVARYASYKNVWWSLANEYDLMKEKTLEDWERLANILCTKDPYNHLRSIHNCIPFYDHSRPWVTHCCMQRQDRFKSGEMVDEWRIQYRKPVIVDEIAYEGNIQHGWGNIGGKEIVRRFWEAICRGGYAGHGETFLSKDGILWWSHGGTLKGESPKRIKFMRELLEEMPAAGLAPITKEWDETVGCEETNSPVKSCYFYYYGIQRPSFREYYMDDEHEYEVELVDTWEMTRTKLGTYKGKFKVDMPGKEYMLVYMRLKNKAAGQ